MTFSSYPRLADSIQKTYILAHQESTTKLEQCLMQEGLTYEVLRQDLGSSAQSYSHSIRALLNHRQAWHRATHEQGLVLVLEADFVPVRGFGQLPFPFHVDNQYLGIGWLYTCAAQIYSLSQEGFADGFSTSMVAYLVTPQSAQTLVEWVDQLMQSHEPQQYLPWDSYLDSYLRDRHFKNFIPFRNYGEHGGLPNPEHQQHGLSSSHRADVLYNALAFMPLYAQGDRGSYCLTRLYGRGKGLARLLMGKYLRWKILRHSKTPWRLLRFVLSRQFTLRL